MAEPLNGSDKTQPVEHKSMVPDWVSRIYESATSALGIGAPKEQQSAGEFVGLKKFDPKLIDEEPKRGIWIEELKHGEFESKLLSSKDLEALTRRPNMEYMSKLPDDQVGAFRSLNHRSLMEDMKKCAEVGKNPLTPEETKCVVDKMTDELTKRYEGPSADSEQEPRTSLIVPTKRDFEKRKRDLD